MKMAQFDDWIDGINTNIASKAGSASNVPRLVVVHVVRSVVRDFLTRSKAWVHKPSSINGNTRNRLVMLPRDTYICKVWASECNQAMFADRVSYTHPNIINLIDFTDSEVEGETLDGLEVSLSVTQSSLECPMFIFDRYYDGILSGALALLQAMPGKAWTEPNMVSYHKQVFDDSISSAKADVETSFNRKKPPNHIPANFI